jgi:hypothetical protein
MRRIASVLAVTAGLAFALPAASATVLYSTGFEAPTFSLGALNGQGGWVVDPFAAPADAAQVVVENTVTYKGGQAVEVPYMAASGDLPYYAVGPIVPTDPIVVSMAINYANIGGTPALFAVTTSPGFDITAGVRLYSNGNINALTAGSSFPAIGTYNPGTWVDVSMTLNYATQTYSVSADGVLLATNLAFCGDMPDSNDCAGSQTSQFGDVEFFAGRPKQSIPAYLDDVSISSIPEPASWSLFIAGVGLAGAALRRNRRPVQIANI